MADQIKLILEADSDGTYRVVGAEDADGHGMRCKFSADDAAADVEGHVNIRFSTEAGGDAESHRIKLRIEMDDAEPDVDGHGYRRTM